MKNLLLFIVFVLAGCTTEVWSPTYQSEWVDGFFVKSDTGELFVTTSDSAYLFGIDDDFGKALVLSREVEFFPSFDKFTLHRDNTIDGTVVLTLATENPTTQLEESLISLGFEKSGLLNRYKLTENIKGRRYVVEGTIPLEKLEKRLRISVEQPATFSETAKKIVATPAAIAIDSVVVVPAVFVGAIIMAAGGG